MTHSLGHSITNAIGQLINQLINVAISFTLHSYSVCVCVCECECVCVRKWCVQWIEFLLCRKICALKELWIIIIYWRGPGFQEVAEAKDYAHRCTITTRMNLS